MATVLLAVIVALTLSHAVPAFTTFRQFQWFDAYLSGNVNPFVNANAWSGAWGAVFSVGIPVFLCGLIQWLVQDWWWGLPEFLFSLVILFLCWGPRDLDQDVDRLVHGQSRDDRSEALQGLPEEPPAPALALECQVIVDQVFLAALRRWFGVLLWFLIAGPAGALLYRLAKRASESAQLRANVGQAHALGLDRLVSILDWPAAQLMTFGLALAADFDAAINAWREFHIGNGRGWFVPGADFMLAAARASVDAEDEALRAEDETLERKSTQLSAQEAMALVWRVLILWLAILALLVLAGWVS
ncbi:MAG: regulatory signaling modulator protein AmpE [Ahniella sp.]|nr:regulatory signaling modulator protein AmpE [Ahniella sp.]